jgi:hypothetical protein
MLVVDKHTLEAVDLLDLVDQIGRQLFDALDRKNVVRCRQAVDEEVALLTSSPSCTCMCLDVGMRYSTGSRLSSCGWIEMRRLFL